MPKKKETDLDETTQDPQTEAAETSPEMADLLAQLEQVTAERDALLGNEPEPQDLGSAYDLVSIYVPFNTQNIDKKNGYDPETGDSYTYTVVQAMHQPEPGKPHQLDRFEIQLDARSVVPRWVAEQLGDRCDVQELPEGFEVESF